MKKGVIKMEDESQDVCREIFDKYGRSRGTLCVLKKEDMGKFEIRHTDSFGKMRILENTRRLQEWLPKEGVPTEDQNDILKWVDGKLRPVTEIEEEGRLAFLGGKRRKKTGP